MITQGERVLYTLSTADAEQINRRRTTGESITARVAIATRVPVEVPLGTDKAYGEIAAWPVGAQAHIGNDVKEGQTFPGIVVVVRDGDEGTPDCANLQVFLDGNDVFWATARFEDSGHQPSPGTWTRQR